MVYGNEDMITYHTKRNVSLHKKHIIIKSSVAEYVPIFRYFKQYFESIEKACLHINDSASMLNVLKGIYTFDDLRKRKTRKRMVK